MRLLTLTLKYYRVLQNLTLEFGKDTTKPKESYELTLLVGVNGSGKSTVFRALVEILRKLSSNELIPFPFQLEYFLGKDEDRHVMIMQEDGKRQVFVNEIIQPGQFDDLWLPKRVVIFTTGNESEWDEVISVKAVRTKEQQLEVGAAESLEKLHLTSKELAIQELPGSPTQKESALMSSTDKIMQRSESRFLFIRSNQIDYLTLCGLLSDMAFPEERLLSEVLNEAKIKALRGFSLKFRMNKGTTLIDDWKYILQLKKVATYAIRQGTDYLLIFHLQEKEYARANDILEVATDNLKTDARVRLIGNEENASKTVRGLLLFEQLAYLANPDPVNNAPAILREVNIFFERVAERDTEGKEKAPPLMLFERLSDGEKSFLGRMCLFSLLGDTESLILLDEPEVHFNDYWKRQIVYLIDKVLHNRASHALITTHSSITLSDAQSSNIIVLDRGDKNFTSRTFQPVIRTLAADPSDIIVNVFGAPQASGRNSVDRVRRALDDVAGDISLERKKDKKVELETLLEQVGPGYWSYQIRRRLEDLELQIDELERQPQ